jgi:hypothetical protein
MPDFGGETRPIVFDQDELAVIVTGVPRRGRDAPDLPVQVHKANKPDKEEPRRSEGTALRLSEGDPLRATLAAPVPESEPSKERRGSVGEQSRRCHLRGLREAYRSPRPRLRYEGAVNRWSGPETR